MSNSLYLLIIISVVVVLITLGLIERFSEVSPRRLFFGIFYISVGLLLGSLLSVPLSNLPKPYGNWLPLGATVLIVIVISAVLWRKHELMDKWVTDTVKQITHLRIPGLTPGPQVLGELVVDTSVLIDGRITDIVQTGFMPYRMVVPRFVLAELQNIADSTDSDRRARGRRGLDAVEKLRKEKEIKSELVGEDFPEIDAVDAKLVALAKKHKAGLLTTDFNLNKRATAEGVKVLNINELSQSLRPVILPGEELDVKVVHTGKEKSQGVGYMPDGTMIVVEKGDRLIDKTVHVKITRALQTAAGKMFFAKVINGN
jgi:uncharacterized protein YacL